MNDIALHIKTKDWLYILLIGVVFGSLLSMLGYKLFSLSLVDGAIFGFILGFNITLFSLLFISNMNKKILPNLPQFYWLPLSIVFSFLSGFLGTYSGVLLASSIGVALIEAFRKELLIISISIGVLTYVVGALLYRFVKMRNQKDVIDNEYIQSRLRSLERQLNPHFLFNSLNSIAELIHHDPKKAEMAVLKVSSFLRNTMKESALLDVKDEIKNLKDYIELENIRFSQRVVLHIDDDIPSWKIPKFSLQLLAENAIKHGFMASSNKLNIYIEFDNTQRVVKVRNDGSMMKSKHFGIGLSNLKQRLELLCKGTIELEDIKSVTFKIVLGECSEDINS